MRLRSFSLVFLMCGSLTCAAFGDTNRNEISINEEMGRIDQKIKQLEAQSFSPEKSDESKVKTALLYFPRWLWVGTRWGKGQDARKSFDQLTSRQNEIRKLEGERAVLKRTALKLEAEEIKIQEQERATADAAKREKRLVEEMQVRAQQEGELLAQASLYGLSGYSGILDMMDLLAEGMSMNTAKTYMLCTKTMDEWLTVSGVYDGYVIYSCLRYYNSGRLIQIAVPRKPDVFYQEGASLLPGIYKIAGRLEGKTVLGIGKEMLVLTRLD